MENTQPIRKVGVLGRLGVAPAERLSGVSRRVLAYLAVKGPCVSRMLTCSDLWPKLGEDRARANLRRALWQLPPGWVVSHGPDLILDAEIDLRDACRIASNALASQLLDADDIEMLTRDLLPGWYEEWVLSEQDQHHLRRIQALEQASRTAARVQRFWLATTAGLAAVCAEPLRESAVSVLVEAHLLEGNRFEAARRYQAYEELLRRELNVEPGTELRHRLASTAIGPESARFPVQAS